MHVALPRRAHHLYLPAICRLQTQNTGDSFQPFRLVEVKRARLLVAMVPTTPIDQRFMAGSRRWTRRVGTTPRMRGIHSANDIDDSADLLLVLLLPLFVWTTQDAQTVRISCAMYAELTLLRITFRQCFACLHPLPLVHLPLTNTTANTASNHRNDVLSETFSPLPPLYPHVVCGILVLILLLLILLYPLSRLSKTPVQPRGEADTLSHT